MAFMFNGRLVRESTKQGNDEVAGQMEAAHRTALAKGEVGIRDRKLAPTLSEFCEKRFEPWIESTTARKTWLDFYRVGLRAIKAHRPLANAKLDEITSEMATEFAPSVKRAACKSARFIPRCAYCAASSGSRQNGEFWKQCRRSRCFPASDIGNGSSVLRKRLGIWPQHMSRWPRLQRCSWTRGFAPKNAIGCDGRLLPG